MSSAEEPSPQVQNDPSNQPAAPNPIPAPAENSNANPNRPSVIPAPVRVGITVRPTQRVPGGLAAGRGIFTGTPPRAPPGTAPAPAPATNNNAGELPQQTQNLFQMRDRLFLALFFRVSLIYARAFPKSLRRVLEFCLLMQSILLLFILGYIHVVYTRQPITCLSEYKDSWPKNGILRVEITTEGGPDYDLLKSYAKEERLRQRAAASQFGHYTDDLLSIMLTADSLFLDRVVSTAGSMLASMTGSNPKTSTEPTVATEEQKVVPTSVERDSPEISVASSSISASSTSSMLSSGEGQEATGESHESKDEDIISEEISKNSGGTLNKSLDVEEESLVAAAEGAERSPDIEAIAPSIPITASGEGGAGPLGAGLTDSLDNVDINDPDSLYFNKTLEEIEMLKMQKKQIEEDKVLNSSVTDFEMFTNSVWMQEQAYIVEYALEYGFLRLSAETRRKLGIPVKLVTLDPNKEKCFGDTFSLFLLENLLGYDDILMSSIKNLAESEENKGYLRNVVTGEQFRFVPMWMARSSYIPALLIMLVFTVSISMLLRYSHHQIFVFIVDLLNNIEGAGSIHIPAAPLFTVILALVGMEAIMSEFFSDSSTAFYVILIVWIADQYDSVCSHTSITKAYWVRFFYLYHFAFYAYHYRFNGQYGGLALLVSWSFIQHSMVYFYHHYELPAILRQAQGTTHLQAEDPSNPPAPGATLVNLPSRESSVPTSTSPVPPSPTNNEPNSEATIGESSASPSSIPTSVVSNNPINSSPEATGSSVSNHNQPILTAPNSDLRSADGDSSNASVIAHCTTTINQLSSPSSSEIRNLTVESCTVSSSPVVNNFSNNLPAEGAQFQILPQRVSPSSPDLNYSSPSATPIIPSASKLSQEVGTSLSSPPLSSPSRPPTIFNDRDINIVNNTLVDGHGDRSGDEAEEKSTTEKESGVNSNDCNPTRPHGLSDSSRARGAGIVESLRAKDISTDYPTATFIPSVASLNSASAQIPDCSSSESQLNHCMNPRDEISSCPAAPSENSTTNNHVISKVNSSSRFSEVSSSNSRVLAMEKDKPLKNEDILSLRGISINSCSTGDKDRQDHDRPNPSDHQSTASLRATGSANGLESLTSTTQPPIYSKRSVKEVQEVD